MLLYAMKSGGKSQLGIRTNFIYPRLQSALGVALL